MTRRNKDTIHHSKTRKKKQQKKKQMQHVSPQPKLVYAQYIEGCILMQAKDIKKKSYVCIYATMQYFRFTVLCQQRHPTYGSIHSTALHLCHYALQNPREVQAFFLLRPQTQLLLYDQEQDMNTLLLWVTFNA